MRTSYEQFNPNRLVTLQLDFRRAERSGRHALARSIADELHRLREDCAAGLTTRFISL